jgi:hypothetical protein
MVYRNTMTFHLRRYIIHEAEEPVIYNNEGSAAQWYKLFSDRWRNTIKT